MNWDAIGAIGEIIGALAVVTTLLILLIQVRQSNKSMIEANALQKAAAVSKHAESIGIWRSQFVQSRDTMALWLAMRDGKELDQIDLARFDNIWVNFVNTQRSNFVGANVVKEEGLVAGLLAGNVAMEKLHRTLGMPASQSAQDIGVRPILVKLLIIAVGAYRNPAVHMSRPDGLVRLVAIPALVLTDTHPFFSRIRPGGPVRAGSNARKMKAVIKWAHGQRPSQVSIMPTISGRSVNAAVAQSDMPLADHGCRITA